MEILDSEPEYFSTRKPSACPACGGEKILNFVYGLPPDDIMQEVKLGNLIYNADKLKAFGPLWKCADCGCEIKKDDFEDQVPFYVTRKPIKCPECGYKYVVPILYGEPRHEAFIAHERWEIALGGCCIFEGNALWHCMVCDIDFYKKRKSDESIDSLKEMPI